MDIARWQALMEGFGFDANEQTFHSLTAAYAEKHRHYHSGEHLQACLRHLDACAEQADNPMEIELALWFHDAIYRPLSGDNERKSADWAARFLVANGASEELVARIHRLVMVTEHNVPTETNDESLLVDIDLSILGADPATYAAFEEGVRKEYRIVPMFIYCRKRIAVLIGFLQRPHIYQNEPFRSERERQARVNLADEVHRLSARG